MGDKDEEKKDGEKKGGDGGAGIGAITVVLKVDLHCEGCAQKVKKSLKHLNGVESVKADSATNKLTVVGNVDPAVVKVRVEEKTKKKVELLSPQPTAKKDVSGSGAATGGGGDAKKSDEKSEKKPDESKKQEEKKPKEPPVNTVVLKTRVHCDGCAHKMKKIISKYEGVQDVSVDLSKDQITIKGTMDMKEMLPYLNAKLKRVVEVVPLPAKKDDGDKKTKDAGGDTRRENKAKEDSKPAATSGSGPAAAGEKEEDAKPAAGSGDGGGKSEEENVGKVEIVNKMEYYGHPYGYGAHTYNPHQAQESGYVAEYWHAPPYMHASPYMNQMPYTHAPPYLHAPQMFSDENPNACSIM